MDNLNTAGAYQCDVFDGGERHDVPIARAAVPEYYSISDMWGI
jgi:hypothetical protein